MITPYYRSADRDFTLLQGDCVELLSQFAELEAMCDEGVDFCVSFSFDGGETMTDIDTVEKAEQLNAILQQDAEDLEVTEQSVTP